VAIAVLLPVSFAWACIGLVSLTTSSSTVSAGGTLTVTGKEFAAGAPVLIHLDTLDGPVLATAPPPTSTMTSQFKLDVTIPSNISTGPHLLIATQTEHNMNGGNPARALIYVGAATPAAAGPAARPATLLAASGRSGSSLVLIGLGVAVVALLLAGLFLIVAGRRRPTAGTPRAS
jgi:alpha-L-fucosidase